MVGTNSLSDKIAEPKFVSSGSNHNSQTSRWRVIFITISLVMHSEIFKLIHD